MNMVSRSAKSKLSVLMSLLVLCIAGRACAALYSWTGAGGGNWNDSADWTGGGGLFPGAADTARINLGLNPIIKVNGSQSVGGLDFTNVGGQATSGTVTLNSGALTIGSAATVVGGQTLTVNGSIIAPVNVSGGTLDGQGIIGRIVSVNPGGHLNGSLHITDGAGIYGGTGNVAGATIDGGLTVDTDQVTWAIPGSYNGASTINGDSYILGGSVSGTHTFNGSLIVDSLDAPASLTGTNTINGGMDTWGDPVTISGTTVVNNHGGTFYLTGSMTGGNTIDLGATGTIQLNPYGSEGGATAFGGTGTVNASWFVIRPYSVVSGIYTFNSKVYMYGGTFQGNHTVHGSFATEAGSHAIITPHNEAMSAGTLKIVGAVTLDHSVTLNFNLASPGTTGSGINDLIDITGNLSLDGTLNVNALSGFMPGTYRLFNYTGILTGAGLTLGTMPRGPFSYSIDNYTTGQVNLAVATCGRFGDINFDGEVNSQDIDAIYQHFGASFTSWWKMYPDTNPVGQQDVTYEVTHYMLTNYADANLDRCTNFTDFQALLDHWQAPGGWAAGDFNGDGIVDFLDFQVLLNYWNPLGWSAGASQVPEPATLCLLALGAVGILRRGRK